VKILFNELADISVPVPVLWQQVLSLVTISFQSPQFAQTYDHLQIILPCTHTIGEDWVPDDFLKSGAWKYKSSRHANLKCIEFDPTV